jgi:hypothetical protein
MHLLVEARQDFLAIDVDAKRPTLRVAETRLSAKQSLSEGAATQLGPWGVFSVARYLFG